MVMTRADRESLILGEAAMGRVGWRQGHLCEFCADEMTVPDGLCCGHIGNGLEAWWHSRLATPDEVAKWLAERGER